MGRTKFNGPWSYDLSDRLSDGSDCLSISDVDGSSVAEMMCPADVEERYARLIAAGPDLYQACKQAAEMLNVMALRGDRTPTTQIMQSWESLKAALALVEEQKQ